MENLNITEPNWEPLLKVAGDRTDEFMWMCSTVVLGTKVHQYKHRDTRRYLNLGENGKAYRRRDVVGLPPWAEVDLKTAMDWALI